MKKCINIVICLLLASGISCKKHNDEPPVPYATFKVNGVQKTFREYNRFTKDFCSSSTFCGKFYLTTSTDSYELIKIGIPGDPIVGHVYETGEYRFSCFYLDSAGTRYDFTTSPFKVEFSLWEGQGGWAKGTFSGWMRSADNDSILFENGYFQDLIWTMGTK